MIIELTLLSLAILSGEVTLSTIGQVGTAIELLIARALESTRKVDESVTLDAERTVRDTRVEDRSGCDTAESAGEGLRVVLANVDGACVAESGNAKDDEGAGELHVDKLKYLE